MAQPATFDGTTGFLTPGVAAPSRLTQPVVPGLWAPRYNPECKSQHSMPDWMLAPVPALLLEVPCRSTCAFRRY